MSRTLPSTLRDLALAIRSHSNAWASARDTANKAHLAAVMGPSLARALGRDGGWDTRSAIESDDSLSDAIWDVCEGDTPTYDYLVDKISSHVEWLTREIGRTIEQDIRATSDPVFRIDPDASHAVDRANEVELAHRRSIEAIEVKLRAARQEAEALEAQQLKVSQASNRASVIRIHEEQCRFIERKATDLQFVDDARADLAGRTQVLKDEWVRKGKLASKFFTSKKYKSVQSERKSIESERSSVELELQSYFDHHSQGASHSETVKPDRVSLKLAPDLESSNAGFRQIQLVDMYCLSRGNEMWAIIPDLLRQGHEIDAKDCVHWRAPVCESAIPESVRSYRKEQNRAFAQKLLNLCSPGLRSKLLARHKHGVSKTEFKADQHDGVALYWVMLQLYHPLSREHRRKLEMDITKFPPKFMSGNPLRPLEELQGKLQEANDIMLRLRWDTIGIPIIDALSTRDPLFAVELSEFRELPLDPDDSGVEIEKMLSHACTTIEMLNTARKQWDERGARQVNRDSEIQKLRKQVDEMHAYMSSGNVLPGSGRDRGKQGFCQKVGCGRKIERWTKQNNWKLCGTCLLEVKSTGNPVKLVDGSTWGRNGAGDKGKQARIARATCELNAMKAAGANVPNSTVSKSARKAAARKRKRDAEARGESTGQDLEADADDAQARNAAAGGPSTEDLFQDLRAKRKLKTVRSTEQPPDRK